MDNQEILNKFFKEKMPEVEIDFSNINNPKLISYVRKKYKSSL